MTLDLMFKPSGGSSSSSANLSVRSVTTTDSCTNADDVLLLSGASFTETLFSAVGNSGKVLRLAHAGTSLTQIYTLNTTSGQTIGGIASGSYKLATNGEELEIVSDGANWIITNHTCDTGPVSFTPGVGGTTGFGTITGAVGKWWRRGNILHAEGNFTCGTTAAAAGAIAIPGSLSLDTAGLSITGNTTAQTGSIVGDWDGAATASNSGNVLAAPGTSTTNMYWSAAASQATSHLIPSATISGNALGTGNIVGFRFSIAISGWQP